MAGEHYPVGRTLNLSTGLDINNYDEYMGTEFLHPCFDYRLQHCWAVGYIERPLTADLSLPEPRGCHLELGPPVGGGAPDIREGDPTMSTTGITAPADAAGRWLTRFREKPLEALDGALTGRVHLGAFSRPALATSLFSGLIRFAEGLARRGAGPDALHDEIEYLCALQSLTPAALGRHLRKALNQRLSDRSRSLNKDAHAWLESAVPMAFKAPRQGSGQVVEHSPLPAELSEVVNRIRRDGLAKARDPLDRLTRGHRQYYERTGDSYYLVCCFERLSRTVRDLGLARDLAHEALRLEPSNHNNWAALGLALDAAGDWTRARAVFWHARWRFPDDAALIAYAEAVRRFPHDPVATLGYGHALCELEGPDAALPVLRTGVQAHPDNLPLRSDYTDALIQAGEIAEAEQQLKTARRINARSGGHNPKLDQLAERLDLAKAGRLQELSLHRRDPVVGPAGNPDALSDIAGSGLAYTAALGESTLFRHAGELERAGQAIRRLPAGPERDAEQGLWIAIHDSWGAAVDWWRDRNT